MNADPNHLDAACESAYSRVTAYLWGETSKAETQFIDAHRAVCDACQEYFVVAENALCRETYPLFQAYLDRELSPDERAQFERHISVCERCRGHFQFDGRMIRIINKRIAVSPAQQRDVERLVDDFRTRLRGSLGSS